MSVCIEILMRLVDRYENLIVIIFIMYDFLLQIYSFWCDYMSILVVVFLLPLTNDAQGLKGLNLARCGTATCLGFVMTFCIKEDDLLLYRSLDRKRTSLGLGVGRGQSKYTKSLTLQFPQAMAL